MSHPAPSPPADPGQPLDMSGPARTFQHYEVLRRPDGSAWELGRGAMGITYKAFDVNLCCEVALKVVNAALLDHPNARERFVREARAAAALRHRNVASVYHLGNDGERFFYAMEFIDGETLDALVRRDGPLPAEDALRLIEQTARALAAAERQGLIHRDIKPANLMVVHEDADDHRVVKVIDFGLARPVTGAGGSSGQLTVSGFVGTPQFASPEQLEERPLDARSDIYSLGVTAWFLLTGSAPFTGSLATICQQHLTRQPPIDLLPAWLPAAVRRLLLHTLEKDPAARPQNAVELRREIEACLDAVRAVPIPGGKRPARPAQPGGRAPGVGTVLNGRYELVSLRGDGGRGPVFAGVNRASGGEPISVTLLSGERSGNDAAFERLASEVRLIQAATHPHLLRVHALERGAGGRPGFLVTERLHGGTLVDLLAARSGVLPVPEALRLLGQAAAAADHAVTRRLETLGLAVHQVNIHFLPSRQAGHGEADGRKHLADPMNDWPAWTLKIDALGRSCEAGEADTWAGEVTLVPGHGSSPDRARKRPGPGGLAEGYTRALAILVYELLGGAPGPWNDDVATRAKYVSLPALNEAANRVLRQVFEDRPAGETAHRFYETLARAAGYDPIDLQVAAVRLADRAPIARSGTLAPAGPASRTPAPAPPPRGFDRDSPVASALTEDEDFGAGSISSRLTLVSGDPAPVGRWIFATLALVGVFVMVVAGVWIALAQRLPQDDARGTRARTLVPTPPPLHEPPRRAARHPQPTVPPPLPAETADPPHSAAIPVTTAAVSPANFSAITPAPASGTVSAIKNISVRIQSIPPGAVIQSGGRTLGTTPLEAELSPGAHELIARYADWPEIRETLMLGVDQPSATTEIRMMPPELIPASENPPTTETARPRRVFPSPTRVPAARASPAPTHRQVPAEPPVDEAAPSAIAPPVAATPPEIRRALPPLTPFDPDGPVPAHDGPTASPAPVDPAPAGD